MENHYLETGPLLDMVVLAAGRGARMLQTENKMFMPLNGVPILYRTLFRLERMAMVQRIVLILRDEERTAFDSMVSKYGTVNKISAIINGGQTRADSVRNGLSFIDQYPGAEIVMTHDGARPFVSEALVCQLAKTVEREEIAIPVRRIAETVRQQQTNGLTQIVDRDKLYLTQTPQAFHRNAIKACFLAREQASRQFTDEAGYFEALGKPVRLVEGDEANIKITTPSDLSWAAFLLEQQTALRLPGVDTR